MLARRPILKRLVVWSLAAALLLTSYVAGEPFVTYLAVCRCQPAIPVVHAVYAPLIAYRIRGLPGTTSLRTYSLWGAKSSLPWFARESLGHQFPAPHVMIQLDEDVYEFAVTADGTLAPVK
jgi:hypothetical protein